MANTLFNNVWSLDTIGIVSETPVWVKGIMYYPNAVDGEFTLKSWDTDSTTLNSGVITYTITTSTDDTITASAGSPLPSTWLDGNIIKCLETTGTDTGVSGLIKTAGNNTVVVVHYSPFTTEAAKVGSFACYPSYTAFKGKASKAADTETSMWFPFPGERGFEFRNLALDDLDTSDVIILYLG